ncbi:zinc finger protein CONSTANS-LIKE 6 [Hevea brasiliensis]|uniref:zinc finger protein CONSTANS-LIKE 6 n=1 Tax=Hevea brasiliensis TaxID=3981 RepID=UPI0025E3E9A5|nr:zinc finger protein CONSTANS-LIKE 6 [Hevea brasiliensis]
MISDKNVANAVGSKMTRACDSCIRKQARWYCAADDAFLCQACNSSVHSANPLARRHERVRLKTASLKYLDLVSKENCVPSWHRGFTRKARTPRYGKPASRSKFEQKLRNTIPLVPEVGSDEICHEENEEERLLYRVPIFDPFVAQLCTPITISSNNEAETTTAAGNDSERTVADGNGIESKASFGTGGQDVESLHGFLPSDMDLAEFDADVESLLGRGLENDSFGMEEMGLADCKEEELQRDYYVGRGKVKLEEEEEAAEKEKEAVRDGHVDTEIEMAREPPFELSFNYDSATCGEEDEKVGTGDRDLIKNNEEYEDDGENLKKKKKRKILLRLDYEAVITAWASKGSPWTTGNRPDVDSDECWQEYCMGICGAKLHHHGYGDHTSGVGVQHPAMADGGREARVSRYREKRRTRLFSKKIRYEVRKLNAEKRPRMKGRFVKRASFAGLVFPLHTI